MEDRSWQEIASLADSFKAIGQSKVYLVGYKKPLEWFPWNFVTEVEDGSMHRISGPVSANFTAAHPCGITFSWSFDYETSGSNGSSTFSANLEDLHKVLGVLPKEARAKMCLLLKHFAQRIELEAKKWQDCADSQYAQAASINSFIASQEAA